MYLQGCAFLFSGKESLGYGTMSIEIVGTGDDVTIQTTTIEVAMD